MNIEELRDELDFSPGRLWLPRSRRAPAFADASANNARGRLPG